MPTHLTNLVAWRRVISQAVEECASCGERSGWANKSMMQLLNGFIFMNHQRGEFRHGCPSHTALRLKHQGSSCGERVFQSAPLGGGFWNPVLWRLRAVGLSYSYRGRRPSLSELRVLATKDFKCWLQRTPSQEDGEFPPADCVCGCACLSIWSQILYGLLPWLV